MQLSTSHWVLCTPIAGWNMLFQNFCAKNVRNNKKIELKFSKKWVFEFAPKCWLSVLKEPFDINNMDNFDHFLTQNPSTSVWVQFWKKILVNFGSIFLLFFSFFSWKMVKRHILTSIWSTQHPKAGRNKQQMLTHRFWIFYSSEKYFSFSVQWLLPNSSYILHASDTE